ncbi:MAG: orotidine-5'-phosphate decarboxylase [Myxococcales bacterium]
MKGRERIIAALDVPDPAAAAALASKLAGRVGLLKVGLELFVAHGRAALDAVAAQGLPVFLDLKLHDIPQTVESAARGAGALGAALVTVHASGGAAMVAAAKRGLQQGAREAGRPAPRLLAVTVLTSLSDQDLQAVGLGGPSREAALRLGLLAVRAGADGLVCSPAEVEALRAAIGRGPLLVVPGIRPAGAAKGDQQRTGTPAEAVRARADYLVVGRPLRDAPDPGAAADAIAAEIDG